MNRGKIVAIITGAVAITIAIAYLFFVLLLDTRGEMKPAPITQLPGAIRAPHVMPPADRSLSTIINSHYELLITNVSP